MAKKIQGNENACERPVQSDVEIFKITTGRTISGQSTTSNCLCISHFRKVQHDCLGLKPQAIYYKKLQPFIYLFFPGDLLETICKVSKFDTLLKPETQVPIWRQTLDKQIDDPILKFFIEID